ncbi:peptidylprolyl isomerase [Rhizobium sp. T1470]|uniref:peptidylprolyl isomerase n=1 Tax=unclassified Rhizobium TaxID=2613769 RepID=UPI001AAE3373|nr:peptidylprolyl isomerase [Rhizobium sp. T1473]MCA0802758.1 peptidyl-prolyl cis-trans isomerase [Rhizobium sp. T1473]
MKVFREPLLHFAVAGAVLFGGYSWLHEKRAKEGAVEAVRISEGDVRWLKQTWSSQWLRDPTSIELKGLVEDLSNERLLARAAKEMGLDQDDTIIRRRLAQKLKFMVEDTAQLAEPAEAELRTFYAANSSRFETPGRLSFKQVYFSPERRVDAAADAKAVLARLNAGDIEPAAGDRLLIGDSFDDTEAAALSGMFGADFTHDVLALQPGGWRGPVKSGYGFHLVFVTQHMPAATKPFETVRDAVLAEWRSARQAELTRDYLAELRRKYGLELEDGVSAMLGSELASKVAAK